MHIGTAQHRERQGFMMRFKEINIYDIHTGDYVGTSYRLENDDETPRELYRIVKELSDSG